MNWGGPVYGRYSIQCKCFIFLLFAYMRQCTMRQCTVCSFFTASWFSCAVKLYIRGIFSLCVYVQILTFNINIYAFSRHFYPKRLTIAFRLYIFINTCVSWESNPQPFAQLTQCSTTEPHSVPHRNTGTQEHTGTLCGSVYTNMCLLKY